MTVIMPQLRLGSIQNNQLFSNYYLEHRLPLRREWIEDKDAKTSFAKIRELFRANKKMLAVMNEPQLEEDFVRPVLDIINPHYNVQQDVGGLTPDFLFYPSDEAKNAGLKEKNSNLAVAVGDAKRWGTEFQAGFRKAGSARVRTPTMQIYDYFTESGTRWGILTDGGRWRLLYREVRRGYYYEVNLADILEKDDFESFKYFYYFFRLQAFEPGPSGKSFLDEVFAGSETYAQEVEEELKERVYRALLETARGFHHWKGNNLDAASPDVRARIRTNCLILLTAFCSCSTRKRGASSRWQTRGTKPSAWTP